jgi:signal transduction histidine kinase
MALIKNVGYFICLLLIAVSSMAQQPVNNLPALLKKGDSLYKNNFAKEGIKLLQQQRSLINDDTPVELASAYYWQLGELLYKVKNYAAFEKVADTLLSLHPSKKDTLWMIKGSLQKAYGLIHLTKLSDATTLLQQIIDWSTAIGNTYYQAKGYQGIGAVAFQGRQIAEVKKQLKRAIEIFKSDGFDEDAALLICSLSRTFVAESTIYIDSAFYWNNQAKFTGDKYPKNLELNYIIWQNEADYYARKGDFNNAEKAFEKAEQIALKMPSQYSLGGLLQIKSYAAFNAGRLNEAVQIAEKSKAIFLDMGDFSMLKKSFQLLYVIHEEKQDFKSAYEALNEYVDISDSILTQQSMEQINDLNVKYETAAKEKKIAEQTVQIIEKNSRLRTLLFSLVAAGLLVSLLLILYHQRQKNYKQSLITLKKEQDFSLLKALMTGEEKERTRLARELHDGLGGILAAAQMQISNVVTHADPIATEQKEKAGELVQQAAIESRRIAHNLLPETLLRHGLDEALKEYCQSISASKLLLIDYTSVGVEQQMEQSVSLSIYRIIQELVSNIIKHAKASEAFIQLHQTNGKLAITIEDNGIGLMPEIHDKTGIGLRNIQSRISYLNGSFDIRSEAQKGTSVYIEIQLDKNAQYQ